MNLLEIRQNLVRDTGHWELVTDAENDDYTDNGADRFISDGAKMLDQLCPAPVVSKEQRVRVYPGQYLLTVPSVRAIEHVEIWDSSGNKHDIEQLDYEALLNEYNEICENVDADIPQYLARVPNLVYTLVSNNFKQWYAIGDIDDISVVDLTAGPLQPLTNVGMDSHWHLDNNRIVWSVDEAYDLADIATFPFRSYLVCVFQEAYIGEITVSLDVTLSDNVDLLCAFTYIDEQPEGVYVNVDDDDLEIITISASGVHTITSSRGTYNVLLIGIDPADSLITQEAITDESVVINDASSVYSERKDTVLVMPPADESYTLRVTGTVHDREFSLDTDETWWSANHPELLILAARVGIETSLHRNESGAQQIREQVMQRINEIAAHLTYERVSGRHDKATING